MIISGKREFKCGHQIFCKRYFRQRRCLHFRSMNFIAAAGRLNFIQIFSIKVNGPEGFLIKIYKLVTSRDWSIVKQDVKAPFCQDCR